LVTLSSCSTCVALVSPTFSLSRSSWGSLPARICWRISGTRFGHSESVERGQPSGGLVFSYDLSSGLSDHLGLGEGLGLMRFMRSKTAQTPLAPMVTAFSTYLIGLCIVSSVLSGWWPVASLRRWPRLQRRRRFADG